MDNLFKWCQRELKTAKQAKIDKIMQMRGYSFALHKVREACITEARLGLSCVTVYVSHDKLAWALAELLKRQGFKVVQTNDKLEIDFDE